MEVFISYSTKDSTVANAVCAALENSGIGCFIAPRDIHPGLSYASEIIRGINEVKAFLVIISSNSNESEHVANEVEIAFNAKKTIIPFFVENVPMSLELKYYLSRKHWLIAYPHYEQQLPNLVKVLSELLGVGDVPAQSDEDDNVKKENGIANAENGKPDGVEDCPPALRGTSVAEGVNDSPFTDDGGTVDGNSSGSCHPERSEGSYKYANEEILPPSGRQNDNGEKLKDESEKMKDDSDGVEDCPPVLRGTSVAEGVNDSPVTDDGETVDGDLNDNGENGSQGLIGSSKKRWAIIIAVLVISVVAALLGTMSGSERGYDDNAAERELVATDVVPASATDVIPAAAVEIQIPQKNDNSLSTRTFTVNGVSFKMVAVDGGTFTMGATSEQQNPYDDEKPVHNVTLSDYFIGETEVTQALWEAVMGTSIYDQAKKGTYGTDLYGVGNNNPMYYISYDDCITFINKLNSQLSGQLPSGRKFRLPTEAEWEFAARGGNRSRGNQYSGSNSLGSVAWYGDNSNSQTHPVKQKQANELGLYDMSGNVYEWCYDWYGNYSSSSQTNPKGPSSGSGRVLRGGSWINGAQNCRVANRSHNSPDSRINNGGLRLAL